MHRLSGIAAALLASSWLPLALAETDNQPDLLAPAPPPGPTGTDQELVEPEVTIIRRRDRTVEEYRINGRLYMIKVTPSKGPAYFLVDSNGNGDFDMQRVGPNLEPRLLIPSWVLFRW
jgi:hypothetical protein